ncbi:MAG: maltotransferase domain-containing protein [Actinomycetota bacterium]
MRPYLDKGHITIERVRPQVDDGAHRAKAVVGDVVEVSADIFRDGTDILQAVVRYKGPKDARWSEAPMVHVANDRYAGTFRPTEIGPYMYTIQAWTDRAATWRRALQTKAGAGQEVDVELAEGALMLAGMLESFPVRQRPRIERAVKAMRASSAAGIKAALDDKLWEVLAARPDRSGATTYERILELTVDRELARFGAWYELFPRSTGTKKKHGTFATAADRLESIAELGFDVVYLPPIHPIGTTNRKGRNNTLTAGPDDVGSPWAIGNKHGGHTAVDPNLGTIEDFDAFVSSARRLGLEVALDYAIQCSPDHPWVTQHPQWFHHRPDGTIKYAENPPKKYQDIYPINFDTEDREGLWSELKGVLDFWISHGVKVFRVDNPHTKPLIFWEWLIDATQTKHPDVIFLSVAFTRPKVMRALAKIGFTQSYTYFTWRNSKHEIIEYMTELAHTETADYFRPNFFANTPDILHEYLQTGGLPAFKIRLVLAALLSPSYGIYSGYEFAENMSVAEGSEEYLHSEKYELRPRPLPSEAPLAPFIKTVNEIRRKHPALSRLTNLYFHPVDKDAMLAFSKTSADGDGVLVIVNLNPFHWEEATVHLDLGVLGLDHSRPFEVHDLVTDSSYEWRGSSNYVRLDPAEEPAHIFRVGA